MSREIAQILAKKRTEDEFRQHAGAFAPPSYVYSGTEDGALAWYENLNPYFRESCDVEMLRTFYQMQRWLDRNPYERLGQQLGQHIEVCMLFFFKVKDIIGQDPRNLSAFELNKWFMTMTPLKPKHLYRFNLETGMMEKTP